MKRIPHLFALLCVASVGCQPLCGMVFDVVLPEGSPEGAQLRVEVGDARDSNGQRAEEPSRLNVAHTERGFVVEVAWFEPGVEVAPLVWVDVDGNGERGPGDLEAQMREVHLDGAGCDGMTTIEEPLVLAPIPPSS